MEWTKLTFFVPPTMRQFRKFGKLIGIEIVFDIHHPIIAEA